MKYLKKFLKMHPERSIGWFIEKHGYEFELETYPDCWERGYLGDCFMNAFRIAETFDLYYVEGYAVAKSSFGIPLMHAWVALKDLTCYDPTWKDGITYYGVPLDLNYVREVMLKSKVYGVIDNMELGFPLIRGKHVYNDPFKSV